ncbi:MAG: flagellin [Methanomassiliicoccales archaeon PtaU1.Bin124]|nr:MAG: flagellin [Methanomassiliicoccales archaeon PtaU1.Bin124]
MLRFRGESIIRKFKNDTFGDIGIGMVILFIAFVLVGAVAASVLIQSSNIARERGEDAGDNSITEVSASVVVKQVVGSSQNDVDEDYTSHIKLTTGNLSGQELDSKDKKIVVDPGDTIAGTVNLKVHNLNDGTETFPFAYVTTWQTGAITNVANQISADVGPGQTTFAVDINITAPSTAGRYYLVFAATDAPNFQYVLSGTDTGIGAPNWADGNEVYQMTDAQLSQGQSFGYTRESLQTTSGYENSLVAIEAVEIIVDTAPMRLPVLELLIGLPSGAPDLRLDSMILTMNSGTQSVSYVCQDQDEGLYHFGLKAEHKVSMGPWETGYHVLGQADLARITLVGFIPLYPSQTCTIKLMTTTGILQSIDVVVPECFWDQDVVLV